MGASEYDVLTHTDRETPAGELFRRPDPRGPYLHAHSWTFQPFRCCGVGPCRSDT